MKRLIPVLCACLLLLCGCQSSQNTSSNTNAKGDLEISLSALTTEPTFVSTKSGSLNMELIAMKADDGSLRLSYNTCQSCNGSPYAYFAYEDGTMTCQNCGLSFDKSVVGTQARGCNPILVEGYELTNDKVTVPASVLSAAAENYFTNWRDNAK